MGKLSNLLQKREKEKDIRYILSIDGGGMRGIIPAYLIFRLAEDLRNAGDERPFYSHFDLIAGTSTGALLSLGLTTAQGVSDSLEKDDLKPFAVYEKHRAGFFKKEKNILKGYIHGSTSPSSLTDIYLKNGSRIFPRHIKNTFSQLFGEKYDIKPYEDFLLKEFADARLADSLAPTIAVAYDCPNARPYVFRSYDKSGFFSRDVARASTAAPLYFPPAILTEEKTGERLILSDGGLCANNPSLIAYAEARELYPRADEFRIISLSTCRKAFKFDPSRSSGGAPSWATSITRIYSTAQEKLVDAELERLPDVKYIRLEANILDKRIPLDDTSKESLDALIRGAEKVYEENKEKIAFFIEEMKLSSTRDSVRLFDKES